MTTPHFLPEGVAGWARRALGPALLGSLLMCNAACADRGGHPHGDKPIAPATAPTTTAPTTAPATVLTVADLLQGAASLKGQAVTVQGRFAGWSGGCAGGAPRNRSDWMLVQQDGGAAQCVYVSGALPPGVSAPPDTASNGQPLTLRGRVDRSDDGRFFLNLTTH